MRFCLNMVAPSTNRFVFTSVIKPDVKDFLVIHNPPHVICETPLLMRSTKTLEEHISYITKEGINKAIIVAEDISFVQQCPNLEYLSIIPAISVKDFDYSPLYSLPKIRWLQCEKAEEGKLSLDCSRLKYLEHLSVDGWNGNLNFASADHLKTLFLAFGQSKEKDLDSLLPNCTIENLVVGTSKITSLSGIEGATQLKRLELYHNRKLADISALSAVKDSLIWLDISDCNGITDYSVLSQLHNLELLRLSGTKGLPSLDFIEKMPELKCLVVSMDVFDGDLSKCINIPYVSIQNRKHFSHKDKDFKKTQCFPFSISAYE